jgi:hypothetical protein
MQETMPIIFLPYIVGFVGVLVGIVWQNLNEKIKSLQENEKTCPIHNVKDDVATIKNDIKWLKEFLIKSNK